MSIVELEEEEEAEGSDGAQEGSGGGSDHENRDANAPGWLAALCFQARHYIETYECSILISASLLFVLSSASSV